MADVEADTDRVEVAGLEDGEQVFRRGDLVLQILQQQAHAERGGEGFEVLDGSERALKGGLVPGGVLEAEVQDDGGEGDLLGRLDGALDLVHGGDSVGLLGGDQVEIGRDVARPLGRVRAAEVAPTLRDIDGLMQHGAHIVGAEPGGELAHGGRIGVVEVVARGEDFDCHGTAGLRAGGGEGVQQAGVQAVLEEDVSGDSGLHCC